MSQLWRTDSGGRIDRTRPIPFVFDGVDYDGYAGDTVASALLANGVRRVATSSDLGRPRGVVGSGVDEPCAVIQVEQPFPDPMRPATVVELAPGFAGRSIAGRGRLADSPDPARYDAVFAHCDVLVVGAGPAGLAAAREAAAGGERVIVCDEQAEFGGHALTLGTDVSADLEADIKELAAAGAELLPRTSVFGYYDDNFVIAVERRTDHRGLAPEQLASIARERVHRIRAGRVVLATGAHERLVAFAGNDRPGVMLAGAAATYASRYGVRLARRAVVFTTNDSTDLAVAALRESGVEVVDVVDAREGRAVVGTRGGEVLESVLISTDGGAPVEVAADLLAVSGGWNPAVQLWTQAGGSTRWDPRIGAFVPATGRQRVECVGSLTGEGLPDSEAVWMVPPTDGDWSTHFVDLQRDVTIPDIRRALGTGMSSVEHVKRYTTAGTAHDQGRTSGTLTSGIVATELGREIAELGTTSFRGPYASVSFAALAGRSGGVLLDPVRTTSMHFWHAEHGAVFEDVGQWKRPLYYPRPGEDFSDAVLRECRTVRESVGFLDASTLGKIDVQGPDAAAFLDLVYTNMISTLKVGSIRYGVLCHADGMVFDDGTVARIAADRFLVTTTTGNAAPVLAWFEEWLQTEWPHLGVFCTSVTEQWATVAIAGPRSRAVVGALAPDLAVDNDSFPFMTWRDTVVTGLGGVTIPARVCRISFSGELAYEVNVSWGRGAQLWAAVAEAGAAQGSTPYGTETMHVLRAEKGYPIVGQDTDGTVIPHDLGLGWAVSKKKPDFIGKRSFARADATRPDRKQLVGLLPDDEVFLLREGTQIVAAETTLPLRPPVPMLGHVTSSYRSAALGRTFALALVAGGRERIGERLLASVGDELIPVTVHSPVLVDPDSLRRDGVGL